MKLRVQGEIEVPDEVGRPIMDQYRRDTVDSTYPLTFTVQFYSDPNPYTRVKVDIPIALRHVIE